VSAATPGQAALSPAFARWYRLDWAWATSAPEFRTDDQLAETWRQLSDGEREFWAEVDAAQQPQPAPELADTVAMATFQDIYEQLSSREAELEGAYTVNDHLRDLLDEIGTLAANAPEDGDSFGVLEEIAMQIAAVDVPDSEPATAAAPELAAAAPDSEAAEQRAVIDQIWRMCQNPKQTAGTSQGVVVNGERLAARIADLIKNSGMEPF
jgi:hypothetical protein